MAIGTAAALLFHAAMDQPTANLARGDREPIGIARVRFDRDVAWFPRNAKLTYDARANLQAGQGTVSFWWKPGEPLGRTPVTLFLAIHENRSIYDYRFASIRWTGSELEATVRDRDLVDHAVRSQLPSPKPEEWLHLALAWSEASGVSFYAAGKLLGRVPRAMHLETALDQFGFLTPSLSAQTSTGTPHAGWIDEVRVYNAALVAGDVARLAQREIPVASRVEPADPVGRFGWREHAGIPRASSIHVRKVPFEEARAVRKFWWKVVDGRRDTVWPMPGHEAGYLGEANDYRLFPRAEPFDWIRATGNWQGTIRLGNGLVFDRRGGAELDYFRVTSPEPVSQIALDTRSGHLGEIELLALSGNPAPAGAWRSVVAGPAGEFARPVAIETGVRGVRLRAAVERGSYYHVSVRDPLDETRSMVDFDVQAMSDRFEMTLEHPAVVVPPGQRLVVVLASSARPLERIEAHWIEQPVAQAQGEYLAWRLLLLRDLFQLLSEARPWMRVAPDYPETRLRREAKVTDRLYRWLEDMLLADPDHPAANNYLRWIRFAQNPPPWNEPPAQAPAPPWASRQIGLLSLFHEIGRWWMDRRQIATGEFGGGLADDSDLVQNWPGIALMGARSPQWKRSVRRVLDACYRQGMIDGGLNRHPADPLHAYEEGVNTFAPAFLLDYGNPLLFELMMEAARHAGRLTARNEARHRHFRSYSFSAREMNEEGIHGREDQYSHLLVEPLLMVAWYNGSPHAIELLREKADALLDHWHGSRYPQLARSIFFRTDQVHAQGAPDLATSNLLWGVFELTGDRRYLWLLEQMIAAGDWRRAGTVTGPWLSLLGAPGLRAAADQTRFDHNLHADPSPVMTKVLAWQQSGDIRILDDALKALWQHVSQNRALYTEAEQYTDRISIPTPALQRARLGGIAHFRNHIWPGHAVSWENAGENLAALVEKTAADRLRLRLFHPGVSGRRITVRPWRLVHGEYRVVVRTVEGDVIADTVTVVKRNSPVVIDVPPAREVLVELSQVRRLDPLSSLADLAVAVEEVEDRLGLEVPVHNLGAAPTGPFRVSVRDETGILLAQSDHDSLDAPLDLRPRVRLVRFPALALRPGMRIEVSRLTAGAEICDENNRARVPEKLPDLR